MAGCSRNPSLVDHDFAAEAEGLVDDVAREQGVSNTQSMPQERTAAEEADCRSQSRQTHAAIGDTELLGFAVRRAEVRMPDGQVSGQRPSRLRAVEIPRMRRSNLSPTE
jgi:hypothetical protein